MQFSMILETRCQTRTIRLSEKNGAGSRETLTSETHQHTASAWETSNTQDHVRPALRQLIFKPSAASRPVEFPEAFQCRIHPEARKKRQYYRSFDGNPVTGSSTVLLDIAQVTSIRLSPIPKR